MKLFRGVFLSKVVNYRGFDDKCVQIESNKRRSEGDGGSHSLIQKNSNTEKSSQSTGQYLSMVITEKLFREFGNDNSTETDRGAVREEVHENKKGNQYCEYNSF